MSLNTIKSLNAHNLAPHISPIVLSKVDPIPDALIQMLV